MGFGLRHCNPSTAYGSIDKHRVLAIMGLALWGYYESYFVTKTTSQ